MSGEDQGRRELHDAAADPVQEAAALEALDALGRGFKSLEQSMQVAHVWYHELRHLQRDSTSHTPDIPDDLLVALSLLGGTAASLVGGATTMIADGNLYAAGALNRQLVEVEYLAWAFENDLVEVENW